MVVAEYEEQIYISAKSKPTARMVLGLKKLKLRSEGFMRLRLLARGKGDFWAGARSAGHDPRNDPERMRQKGIGPNDGYNVFTTDNPNCLSNADRQFFRRFNPQFAPHRLLSGTDNGRFLGCKFASRCVFAMRFFVIAFRLFFVL